MMESGSRVAGIDVARYDLPPQTALRVEAPAPALRPFVANYHAFDSDPVRWDGVVNWALPTWPTIRFILTAHGMSVRLKSRAYDPVPDAALYGTSSHAREITTRGGVSVGVAVTPLGWSRLFRMDADKCRDRIVPLADLMPAAAVRDIGEQLHTLGDDMAGMEDMLDAFLLARLGPPTAREREIAGLNRIIADEVTTDIRVAADMLGLTPAGLRRLSTRYFGFPPKLLLLRHRFLRSIAAMLLDGVDVEDALLAGDYYDKSHFLRDAKRFLGTTPRRFISADQGYLLARLRAYRALATISGEPATYA